MADLSQDWRLPVKETAQFMGYGQRITGPFADFPTPQQGRLRMLLGGRKAGKTSVLHLLARELMGRPRLADAPYLVPVYIALDAPAITSREETYQRLISEFFNALKKEPLRLCVLQEETLGAILRPTKSNTITIHSFVNALRYLVDTSRTARDLAGQVIGELRLIGLLDNADSLAGVSWLSELLSDLSALFFGNLAVEANIRLDLVIASRGPFYTNLATVGGWQEPSDELRVLLEPLSDSECGTWLNTHAPGLHDQAVAAICYWCGGHPYLVRAFVQYIGQASGRQWNAVDAASATEVAHEQVESLSILADWASDLSDLARQAYRLVFASSADGLSAPQLRRQLRQTMPKIAPLDISRSMDELLWTGIIRRDSANPAVLLRGSQLFAEFSGTGAAITPEVASDPYAHYLAGMRYLLHTLGPTHPQFKDALVFRQRLEENIGRARLYGDNSDASSQRNEIIAYLNELALATCGMPFLELTRRA